MNNRNFKFKIGDKVKVEYLDKYISADRSFKLGEELEINRFVAGYHGNVYFFKNKDYGLYEKQLSLIKDCKYLIPKFKIGDKVKILFHDDCTYFYEGEILTIKKYEVYESSIYYWFKEKDLIGIPQEQLEIVNDTNKKNKSFKKEDKATINYEGKSIKVNLNGNIGKARCNNTDKYDSKKGILIATARALGFGEDVICGIVELLFNERLEDNKPKKQSKEKVEFPKENIDYGINCDKDCFELFIIEI